MRTGILIALGIIIGSELSTMIAIAWTGPTASPPGNNVAGVVTTVGNQVINGNLGINGLAVFGNSLLSGSNLYLNFGATSGSSGYGIRDNNGTLEFKNNSGSWGSLNSTLISLLQVNGITTDGLGNVTGIKFPNGTQTASSTGGGGSGGLVAPAFLAKLSASQGIPNTTYTKVNFGTVIFDTTGNFSSSRFTPTVPGKYLLTAQVAMDVGASVDAFIIIYKNGAAYAWGNRIGQVSSFQYPNVSVVVDANGTTDYFEVYVY